MSSVVLGATTLDQTSVMALPQERHHTYRVKCDGAQKHHASEMSQTLRWTAVSRGCRLCLRCPSKLLCMYLLKRYEYSIG